MTIVGSAVPTMVCVESRQEDAPEAPHRRISSADAVRKLDRCPVVVVAVAGCRRCGQVAIPFRRGRSLEWPGDRCSRRPARLPWPDSPDDPGGVVHLGREHALPPRRRAEQRRGLRGERVLQRRPGAIRGADRRRGRHARPPLLIHARRGDPARLDPSLPRHVEHPCAVLGLGDRIGAARARLHVLLGSDRGVAGRRADRHRVQGQPRVGLRPCAGRRWCGDADRVGRRRRAGPGRPTLACPTSCGRRCSA